MIEKHKGVRYPKTLEDFEAAFAKEVTGSRHRDAVFWATYSKAFHRALYLRLPAIYESLYERALAGSTTAARTLIERFDPGWNAPDPPPGESPTSRKLIELLRQLRPDLDRNRSGNDGKEGSND